MIALGSQVVKPDIPGLREFGFDVDTYDGAMTLQRHLAGMARRPAHAGCGHCRCRGRRTNRHRDRLRAAGAADSAVPRHRDPVVLVDHNPHVGSDMGTSARPVIEAALGAAGVESRLGVSVSAVDEGGATLSTGELLAGRRPWCGVRACGPTR